RARLRQFAAGRNPAQPLAGRLPPVALRTLRAIIDDARAVPCGRAPVRLGHAPDQRVARQFLHRRLLHAVAPRLDRRLDEETAAGTEAPADPAARPPERK